MIVVPIWHLFGNLALRKHMHEMIICYYVLTIFENTVFNTIPLCSFWIDSTPYRPPCVWKLLPERCTFALDQLPLLNYFLFSSTELLIIFCDSRWSVDRLRKIPSEFFYKFWWQFPVFFVDITWFYIVQGVRLLFVCWC